MIRLNTFLLTLLLSVSGYAQKKEIQHKSTNQEDSSKMTMNLGKHQLINQANKIIASKYPDFEFDSSLYEITAWRNSETAVVQYRRIIRFTPLDKKDMDLTYDFEVNLLEESVSPFEVWGFDKFYFPTEEDQEKIDFVIESFGLPRLGFNNSIVENPDMYSIHIDNELAFGKYFLDKITGKECMGSIEGSYAPMPDFPELRDSDPLIEVQN